MRRVNKKKFKRLEEWVKSKMQDIPFKVFLDKKDVDELFRSDQLRNHKNRRGKCSIEFSQE